MSKCGLHGCKSPLEHFGKPGGKSKESQYQCVRITFVYFIVNHDDDFETASLTMSMEVR